MPRIYKRRPLPERFWEKVDKHSSPNGCWLWLANKCRGYGHFAITRKYTVKAHRFSYELHYGRIPEGMLICHHCDNRPCVNPKHLFIGTYKDNMVDAKNKGRLCKINYLPKYVGEEHPRAKLTEQIVREIFNLKGIDKATSLAIRFDMSRSQIFRIWRGDGWKHLKLLSHG